MVDPTKPVQMFLGNRWADVKTPDVLADGRLVVILPDKSDVWTINPASGSLRNKPAGKPFTAETLPWNRAVFRHKNWDESRRSVVFAFNMKSVVMVDSIPIICIFTYDELHRDFVCSYDNGKTWQPCETNE